MCADKSKIEWTDSSWNPIVGCSVVSPGCTNCYAMRQAARMDRMGVRHYEGLTQPSKPGPVWNGQVRMAPEGVLTRPLGWKRPRRIFVNSMGDLFHESVPDAWIDLVFAVMALAPQHRFQILTKRSKRMRKWASDPDTPDRVWRAVHAIVDEWQKHGGFRLRAVDGDAVLPALGAQGATWGGDLPWPLINVWLGVSAEDQARADERIPDLIETPAAVRFVSAEPLIGEIDFTRIGLSDPDVGWHIDLGFYPDALAGHLQHNIPRLNWIIAGGESGPGARPMHPAWARSIRDQCASAGVPFFFKQWGEWAPTAKPTTKGDATVWPNGGVGDANNGGGAGREVVRLGKHRAGRLLDGAEHNGYPPGAQQ